MNNLEDKELTNKVLKCRSRLTEIGVKSARHYFCLKYPEYIIDKTRLDNLWYCKVIDEDFTQKLESFTNYKEVEIN